MTLISRGLAPASKLRAGVPPPVLLTTPLPRESLTDTSINAETDVLLTLLKDEFVTLYLT